MNSINSPLYFIGQGDWEVPNPNDAAKIALKREESRREKEKEKR
jgi:hypothetical protein